MGDPKNTITLNGQEYSKDDLPGELTFTLRKPIDLTKGGESIDTFELREPTAGEFEKMTKLASSNPAGSVILLISLVTKQPLPVINAMGVRDMNEIGEYLMGFIQPGRSTGIS
jgi:hypothetical protein